MSKFSCGFTDITETSAEFWAEFSGVQESFAGYRYVELYIEGDDTYIITSSSAGSGSSSFSEEIRGLQPGTRYDWVATLGYQVGTDGKKWTTTTDEGYFTTEKPPVVVEKWSWSKSNGSATATQTQKAYSAVRNNGPLNDFSYLVWNDMVNKVDEILEASGKSWIEDFATYKATKMSSTDKRLTATRFNSLRENIGRRVGTGISDVSTGDTVYGHYFITLATQINKWIDEI